MPYFKGASTAPLGARAFPARPLAWLLAVLLIAWASSGGRPALAAEEPWRGELDRAVELALSGDLEASRELLLTLEAEHPDEPEIVRRTAQVLARTNSRAEAIERFRRLKTLAPDTLTDREELLVLLLWDGDAEAYQKERRELLEAVAAAGGREVSRSPNFVRELFVIDKKINVDAYEYYPGTQSGPVTPYYLFVVTSLEGDLKGHFVVAENSEKTAQLQAQGEIGEAETAYYLEFRPPQEGSAGSEAALIELYPGAEPPAYATARDAVVAEIAAQIEG